MLMPPDMRSWVPADDLAHFVLEAVSTAFLVILKLARELKLLKVGTISVDGTRVKANASKFHALTYERACELTDEDSRIMRRSNSSEYQQVNGEWKLVCLAYNVKRLHTMIRA